MGTEPKMRLFAAVFLFCCIVEITPWRIFHNGRMVGGNLGETRITHKQFATRDDRKPTEEWYTQRLDHFTPTDETTWQQRYFASDQFYDAKVGGPIFLMIGGEGPASIRWMTSGAWIASAQEHGALLLQLEHRYYGESHPTEDISTENLKYLTSQQALADLAAFITDMNVKYELPSDVKWIAFGGSYPGSLAAWLRFKYPHLVLGAMSASGPLLAQVDFQDYFRVVADSLATYSDECLETVQQGISQIGVLLKQSIGQENLNQIFNLCTPVQDSVNSDNDIANLYETIADDFAGVVQYNNDNRAGNAINIDTVCDILVNQTIGPPVNRLGAVNDLILRSYGEECLDYKYDEMIQEMKNASWKSSAAEGARQWVYQTCTEFGFYQTSTHDPQIFGQRFPIDFFIQQCADIYGSLYDDQFLDEAIERTNVFYGALNINVTNVVFVHGSIDPWHALGVIKTVSEQAPAIYINGTAHCANMYDPNVLDEPQLVDAREKVADLITSWLAD